MKILMVNKFLYARGGAETYCLKVGGALEKKGHEVQYFGMADEKNTVFNSAGLYAVNKDFHARGAAGLLYPLSVIYSRDARRKMIELIRAFGPDVVHLNNINYQLTPSVIDGAAACGVPVVQTVHDTQMLCPSHMMLNLNDFSLCEKCLNHGKIHCVLNRCIHRSLGKSLIGAAEGTLYERLNTYRKVRLFICPSRFMQGMLERDKRFAGRTRVMQNFIELSPPRTDEKEGYVLYFGRLSVEKGVDRLLEACRMLPQIPFVVCGSGPEEERLLKDLPANVRFGGFQTGESLNRLIARAAFSMYFPILYENCPMSVLESQALGTPVLANRIGGIPELIEEGASGRMLDTFTPETYAKAIAEMYSDQKQLNDMSRACLRKRERMVSLERYADELVGLYGTVG